MKYVVGIGNPEQQYDKTRHNVGLRALDKLSGKHQGTWWDKKKLRSQTCSLGNAVLVKPLTYVNNTGEAVSVLLKKDGVTPADFLFICDDVNLMLGKIRLRASGGAGGHHGLESIIQTFGTEDFARLRIGVGSESMPKDDLTDFVLGRFSTQEEKALSIILKKVVLVCETWIEQGFGPAMDQLSKEQSLAEEKS